MSDPHSKHRAYAVLTATYNAGLVLSATRETTRRRFGETIPWQDLLLLGVAVHKLSCILSTDRVASPLRAPVAEGENRREPTGEGMQRALGDLITCRYCLAPWISLALLSAYVRYPAQTRAASAVMGVVAVSDLLNRAYSRLSRES